MSGSEDSMDANGLSSARAAWLLTPGALSHAEEPDSLIKSHHLVPFARNAEPHGPLAALSPMPM